MKIVDKTKKRLLSEAHEIAGDLHELGALDFTTMREFDALCLLPIHELSASKIKAIRRKAGISQSVFARIINVSLAAIKQWERGERKPSGAALKLLNLVEDRGIEAII